MIRERHNNSLLLNSSNNNEDLSILDMTSMINGTSGKKRLSSLPNERGQT